MAETAGNTAGELNVVITANAEPVVQAAAQAEEAVVAVGAAAKTASKNVNAATSSSIASLNRLSYNLRGIGRLFSVVFIAPLASSGIATWLDKWSHAADDFKQKLSDITGSFNPIAALKQPQLQYDIMQKQAEAQAKINALQKEYLDLEKQASTLSGSLAHIAGLAISSDWYAESMRNLSEALRSVGLESAGSWVESTVGREKTLEQMRQEVEIQANIIQGRLNEEIRLLEAIKLQEYQNNLLEIRIGLVNELINKQQALNSLFAPTFYSDRAAGIAESGGWSQRIANRLGGGN